MNALRIGSYYEHAAVPEDQPSLVNWRDFYDFRNRVIRLLRIFGTAGPMGEVNLSADEEKQPCFLPGGVKNPTFFVVDDMYNDQDRVSIVECPAVAMDTVVLESLAAMMKELPGWRVSFSLGDSGLIVSSTAVLVGGRRFWDCGSVSEISERCQSAVDFGPTEPFDDSMNQLWRRLLVGGIDRTETLPVGPTRQWREILRSLAEMLPQRRDGRLTSFDYGQVRNDLHPSTRRELLRRLLLDLPGFPRETLKAAKANIQKDLSVALVESASVVEANELIEQIWSSLEASGGGFGDREIVIWWANLLPRKEESSWSVNSVLQDSLRSRIRHANPGLQLSALFGLARIGVQDIALLVDDAMSLRPEWANNQALMRWLEGLRIKKRSYPDGDILAASEVASGGG